MQICAWCSNSVGSVSTLLTMIPKKKQKMAHINKMTWMHIKLIPTGAFRDANIQPVQTVILTVSESHLISILPGGPMPLLPPLSIGPPLLPLKPPLSIPPRPPRKPPRSPPQPPRMPPGPPRSIPLPPLIPPLPRSPSTSNNRKFKLNTNRSQQPKIEAYFSLYLHEEKVETQALQVLELYTGYTPSSRRSSGFHIHCSETVVRTIKTKEKGTSEQIVNVNCH